MIVYKALSLVLVQVRRKGVRLFLDKASATDRVEWSWPGADLAEPFIAVASSFNGADRGLCSFFQSELLNQLRHTPDKPAFK